MAITVPPLPLKFLFTAIFKDNFIYRQEPEDKAVIAASGSSFNDVQALEKTHGPVTHFILAGTNEEVVLDLETGEFQVNGRPIWVTDETEKLPKDTKLRLIYYRRRQIHTEMPSGRTIQLYRYYVGWQATVEGRNVKAIIGLD